MTVVNQTIIVEQYTSTAAEVQASKLIAESAAAQAAQKATEAATSATAAASSQNAAAASAITASNAAATATTKATEAAASATAAAGSAATATTKAAEATQAKNDIDALVGIPQTVQLLTFEYSDTATGHPVTTDRVLRLTIGSNIYEINVKKIQ